MIAYTIFSGLVYINIKTVKVLCVGGDGSLRKKLRKIKTERSIEKEAEMCKERGSLQWEPEGKVT